jgi:hypothetical protein
MTEPTQALWETLHGGKVSPRRLKITEPGKKSVLFGLRAPQQRYADYVDLGEATASRQRCRDPRFRWRFGSAGSSEFSMGDRMGRDPDLGSAELYLDLADMFQARFEYWSRQADDEHHPPLRRLIEEIAAAMLIANLARENAGDLLREYDNGAGN